LSSTATSLSQSPEYQKANKSIELIGHARRELKMIEAEMGDGIAAIKADFERRAKNPKLIININEPLVRGFCKAHRKELTDGDRVKYADFPAGKVIWRKSPPSVSVATKILAQILASLHARKLAWAIRMTEEIDKEAILANPGPFAEIDGIKVNKGGEKFVIEPVEVPLAGEQHHD
jgi:phage host-nuclease inhibitor protein Gam